MGKIREILYKMYLSRAGYLRQRLALLTGWEDSLSTTGVLQKRLAHNLGLASALDSTFLLNF